MIGLGSHKASLQLKLKILTIKTTSKYITSPSFFYLLHYKILKNNEGTLENIKEQSSLFFYSFGRNSFRFCHSLLNLSIEFSLVGESPIYR